MLGMAADSCNHLGGPSYIISAAEPADQPAARAMAATIFLGIQYSGLRIIAAIVVLFLTGVFATQRLRASNPRRMGQPVGTVPVVKSIYSSVKRYPSPCSPTAAARSERPCWFHCPQPDILDDCLCFQGIFPTNSRQPATLMTTIFPVYVPTTPNPTGGYYIMVKKATCRTR